MDYTWSALQTPDTKAHNLLLVTTHALGHALQGLRTFALIVSAHPYCARNSLRDVMSRHELSARAVEEMRRYIVLVGTIIFMHRFNPLKCSVNPRFSFDRLRSLLIIYVLWKIKENLCCGTLISFNFSALASSNSAIFPGRFSQKSILEDEFN